MPKIKTLADITRVHAQDRGGASALLSADDEREWTYADLDKQANLVANALIDSGIRPGHRIAYLDRNSPEYFIFLFGGAKVNAVSVAVNWRLATEEMEYILNHSEATVLLIGEEFLSALREMNLSAIKQLWCSVILAKADIPRLINGWWEEQLQIQACQFRPKTFTSCTPLKRPDCRRALS